MELQKIEENYKICEFGIIILPEQFDLLIEQAKKANQVEKILCCGDYDNQAKLDNITDLFFD